MGIPGVANVPRGKGGLRFFEAQLKKRFLLPLCLLLPHLLYRKYPDGGTILWHFFLKGTEFIFIKGETRNPQLVPTSAIRIYLFIYWDLDVSPI